MYLDKRDNRTDEMQALRPNGFTEETVISDFPVRDKKLALHIRRRRWLTPEGKSFTAGTRPSTDALYVRSSRQDESLPCLGPEELTGVTGNIVLVEHVSAV